MPQDTRHNTAVDKQETHLIDGIQDLTLEPKQDIKNLTDIPVFPQDAQEARCKEEDRRDNPMKTLTYEMTDQRK